MRLWTVPRLRLSTCMSCSRAPSSPYTSCSPVPPALAPLDGPQAEIDDVHVLLEGPFQPVHQLVAGAAGAGPDDAHTVQFRFGGQGVDDPGAGRAMADEIAPLHRPADGACSLVDDLIG